MPLWTAKSAPSHMESHCSEECTYNYVMLCFIDTRSSITLLDLPVNFWSIQYLNGHGCNTCGHAKYLLPASEPDQLQLKIGYRSWWHLSPVLTTIPSLCSSSRCSSCKINRQNGTFSSQIEPLYPQFQSNHKPQPRITNTYLRIIADGFQMSAPLCLRVIECVCYSSPSSG